jgi:hypothetical protein
MHDWAPITTPFTSGDMSAYASEIIQQRICQNDMRVAGGVQSVRPATDDSCQGCRRTRLFWSLCRGTCIAVEGQGALCRLKDEKQRHTADISYSRGVCSRKRRAPSEGCSCMFMYIAGRRRYRMIGVAGDLQLHERLRAWRRGCDGMVGRGLIAHLD